MEKWENAKQLYKTIVCKGWSLSNHPPLYWYPTPFYKLLIPPLFRVNSQNREIGFSFVNFGFFDLLISDSAIFLKKIWTENWENCDYKKLLHVHRTHTQTTFLIWKSPVDVGPKSSIPPFLRDPPLFVIPPLYTGNFVSTRLWPFLGFSIHPPLKKKGGGGSYYV